MIVLHEMMHATMITYEQNSDRKIYDMRIEFYEYIWEGSRKYTRKLARDDAYGAVNCKILARTHENNIMTDLTMNGK
jgi:hypothetical protein